MGKFIDLSGRRFGKWSVLERDNSQTGSLTRWVCRCDCGIVRAVFGSNLNRGLSQSCGYCVTKECDEDSTIAGFGINDLGSSVTASETYKTWKRMVERCYLETMLSRNPTYRDVQVCEEWRLFSRFKAWMESQDFIGNELDKDILVKGATIYSPENCCFVPKRLNRLLGLTDSKRGKYPVGVSAHSKASKVQARVGKKYLGLFDNPRNAHKAWQWEKADQIEKVIAWYATQDCFRTDVAEALTKRVWQLRLDHNDDVETITL